MTEFDPDRMFHELEACAEERSQAEYQAALLERHGEILLAQIMFEKREAGTPATILKEMARTDPRWSVHIEGEAVAIKHRSRARARYENLRLLAEFRRSQEVTARVMTR